jgi:hypothetical protein
MFAAYSQFNFRIQRNCHTADVLFAEQRISHCPYGSSSLSEVSCLTLVLTAVYVTFDVRIELNVVAVLLFREGLKMHFEDFEIAFCVLCG